MTSVMVWPAATLLCWAAACFAATAPAMSRTIASGTLTSNLATMRLASALTSSSPDAPAFAMATRPRTVAVLPW